MQFSSLILRQEHAQQAGFAWENDAAGADKSSTLERRRVCFFHRLPTELLCAIFILCGKIDDLSAHPRDPRMDPYSICVKVAPYCRTVYFLGRVCARWLSVTRGCPQLWTMVDLPFPQKRDVTVLALCLRYSAGLPMTLHINDNRLYTDRRRNIDACRRFMRMVASNAHRWVGIHIYIRQESPKVSDIFEPLYSLPTGSFASLEHATIRPGWRFIDDSTEAAALRLWDTFYTSSLLRTAHWALVPVRAPAPVLEQLTHVGVHVILAEDVMDLLRACPRLEVFQGTVVPPSNVIPGRNDGYLIPIVTTPIILSHIRILVLSGMYDWTHLFDGLSTPLLDRLEMCNTGIQANTIESMLSRSRAQLVMLALRHTYYGNIFVYDRYDKAHRDSDVEPEDFDPSPYLPQTIILADNAYYKLTLPSNYHQ
ncbi:hypothetical protein BD626DRAFT_526994 [Schizophyllum amplum]|uniref:Uncharacterized protein n=1 Tax=Schizophyllum amplum TaxID=97359 RepID=A0A550BSB5_9AGAR|nr:hypothetical protein BD626DRAFT_526994 [Auriculariopsis ampla]